MQTGDTFVFRSGSDGSHLWVVLSDPSLNPDKVVVVNLTTFRGGRWDDPSCVFEAGEHEWVVRQSYVSYYDARIYTDAHLERLRNSRSLREYAPFQASLLRRALEGAAVSPNLELDTLQILIDQGLSC